ncbi:Hop family adhesin HopQ [Helicobacter pylori]
MKIKKSLLLSLTLVASLLHAEDNGVFLSVGYQIGEAVQKVKNADRVQKLSDAYENLNKLLANHGHSNQEINTNSVQAINQAIGNLNANTQNLMDKTDNSPAYQATLLALQSTVGLWNSIAYAVICGGYTDKPNHNITETFYNQPGQGSDSITCGGHVGLLAAGKNNSLSIEQFATLNKAYQIIQATLKKGLPALNNTTTTVEVTIKTATNAQNINVNNNNNNAADTTVSITDTYINDAQNLLTQAQTIINTLQDNCPQLKGKSSSSNGGTNNANTPSWQTNAIQNSCSVFGTEFSAISDMISNAQNIVQETQQLNTAPLKSITQPHNLNLNSPSSLTALAQKMLKNAQSQAEILKLANQVESDFNRISTGVLKNYIEECSASASNESVSNSTWGKGCAGVKKTLASLESSNASFSSQTPQINQAETLANTIVQELGHNPFKRVGIISSQTNNGAMNGLGVQVGYKQFFGEKKRWGLRYYGFFDYNHAYIKSSFFNSASDVWTYGVGSDLLFNFINDKNTNFLGKNNHFSMGLFGGIQLAGTSWLNSQFVNLKTISNVYSAKVNTANFQFLFNLGLRTNLARPKKKDSHHAAQHGMELGVKIPTINTNYYSFLDTKLEYRRLYSVYLNYVFAY